jgi:hypothetical protein
MMIRPRRKFQTIGIVGFLFFLLAVCDHQVLPVAGQKNEGFSLIALGDAGEVTGIMKDNAKMMTKLFRQDRLDALIFLGDNFYPTGLNFNSEQDPKKEVPKRIKDMLGPFREIMRGLGRQNVHAVPGNHDYYARLVVDRSFLLGLFSVQALPVGISNKGNQRADTISTWTYHYGMPEQAFYQVKKELPDSLQIIFLDSAVFLRTQPQFWRPALAKLKQLLVSTQYRPAIKWRILVLHHPLYSVGDHGGYSDWDPERRVVTYRNLCDPDTSAIEFFFQQADPENLCAARYHAYRDSVSAALLRSGVPVQLALSGHDHTLQLLYYPHTLPQIHLISGAGSKETTVKAPAPERGEYTCPDNTPARRGKSRSGVARLDFESDILRVRFLSSKDGKEIDMGGGKKEFLIKPDGALEAK